MIVQAIAATRSPLKRLEENPTGSRNLPLLWAEKLVERQRLARESTENQATEEGGAVHTEQPERRQYLGDFIPASLVKDMKLGGVSGVLREEDSKDVECNYQQAAQTKLYSSPSCSSYSSCSESSMNYEAKGQDAVWMDINKGKRRLQDREASPSGLSVAMKVKQYQVLTDSGSILSPRGALSHGGNCTSLPSLYEMYEMFVKSTCLVNKC